VTGLDGLDKFFLLPPFTHRQPTTEGLEMEEEDAKQLRRRKS